MSQNDDTKRGVIYSLRQSGRRIVDPKKDIRGREVIDSNGEKMGMIDDLLLDDYQSKIRFIQIAHGGILGIGREHFILPVNTIEKVEERKVHVARTLEDIQKEARYAPELEEGVDTGPAGWWEQDPAGLPGAPVQ